MSSKAQLDDPRDSSLEVKEVLPYVWYREGDYGLGSVGLLLSGLIVMTRNRIMAWAAVIYALNALINGHPLRSKEAGNNWTTLFLCLSAFFAAYFPYFVVSNPPSP